MRIIFVRHGEPDYALDCLTERGKLQAAAAAERLVREGISEIYASPMGRAQETALYTARRMNLPVTTLEFMHEISWGGPDLPDNGHPWTLSDRMILEDNYDFIGNDWKQHPYFRTNTATDIYDAVTAQFDDFLLTQGYRHCGRRFLCAAENTSTIAVFSHGGSGGCVLAHLLSLPFPYVTSMLPYDFASIIILDFPVLRGAYVHPRLALFNETEHIRSLNGGLRIQERPDGE